MSFRSAVRAGACASMLFIALVALPAGAASGPYAGDWPSLGRNDTHTAVATDPAISPAKASTLGIRWMANLYAADLGSPIVAYDHALGKMVVYAGNERGDVFAIDEATGATIWSTNVGVGRSERDTPLFANGDLFIGTAYGPNVYKLDGATGQILCSSHGPASFLASPIAATPPGGQPMVYDSTIDEVGFSGPMFGWAESSCSQVFRFTNYVSPTGPWASPAYSLDAGGRGLLVFGTADPDAKEYAIDAATGALDWVFKVANPFPYTYDIGAAADISPPGVNGFADGVVYVPTKYGIMYALDLTTGSEIWEFDFNADAGATEGGLSSAALVGNDLVFGYNGGAYDLNATTGAKKWHYVDPTGTEVLSSPAIAGPSGSEVVAFADLAGSFRAIKRFDGSALYAYQTNGYVSASPAEADGTFFITSSDGYLYAFAPGGANVAPPVTAFTSPKPAAQIRGTNGTVSIQGTAASAGGIASVTVAVQSGGASGPWYDAATNAWNLAPVPNPATLVPTKSGSRFSLSVPLPPGGGAFTAVANATGASHVADVTGARESFTTLPSKTQAHLATSASILPPGGSTTVSASAFEPGETIAFALGGATLASANAGKGGGVAPFAFAIPAGQAFGPTALSATGETSGKTAATTIDVENAWTQLGYDGTRTSFEPNDTVFSHLIHVGPNLFIARAYDAQGGAAIESSPAVFDNVAFFGNDAGTMSAIDTSLGSTVWQYTTPSGAAIRSAPAVDGGYVAFGSDDGTLYALSAATGALAGTAAIGGELTSPAIANGTIYVGSRGGTIAAVAEGPGSVVWSHALGEDLSSSVAVDATNGILIAADDSGHVSAYDAAAGSRLWHVEVGGALKVTPAISGGTVYVGSTNGNVTALNETNGSAEWTYDEGSAIAATPAVAQGEVGFTGNAIYVGSTDRTLTALAADGSRAWKVPFPSPIVGLAAASGNVVLVELADGMVAASRGPNDGNHFFSYQTAGSLDTAPALVSGAVYVGAGDGGLYAFTPYGRAPFDVGVASRARARLAAMRPASRWPATSVAPRSMPATTMTWSGARTYPVRTLARLSPPATNAVRFHGGATQRSPRTYVVYWQPRGSFASSRYVAATAAWLASARGGGNVAATERDTAPMPPIPSDTAYRNELVRVATRERWAAGPNVQYVLMLARTGTGSPTGYCAYHAALPSTPAGSPFVYAVIPYPNGASACGASAGIAPSGDLDTDLVLPTLARERTDVASDPLGDAWHDASGREAGDFAPAPQ